MDSATLPAFEGLDPDSPDTAALMADLQGNILAGHGRDHSAMVLIDMPRGLPAGDAARTWFRDMPLTSAAEQDGAARRRGEGAAQTADDGAEPFRGLYLTALGYRRLGFKAHEVPGDIAFRQGAARRAPRIGDGRFTDWEDWAVGPLGAALLLAHDDPAVVEGEVDAVRRALRDFAPTCALAGVVRGGALRRDGWPREAFGFADGLAQPLFLRRHIARFRASAGDGSWDPAIDPRHLVLAPELAAGGRQGSYLVVRKLDQDVAGFQAAVNGLADALGVPEETAEAFLMGRHKDGTPAVTSPNPEGSWDPAFDYASDQDGGRCPVHAHVRRMNPRSGRPHDRGREIARRGFAYAAADDDGTAPGLAFLCFQQDISRQFEFLQRVWADGHSGDPTVDAVIGRGDRRMRWPRDWDSSGAERVRAAIRRTVRLRGAAYFFAPSIPFMRSL